MRRSNAKFFGRKPAAAALLAGFFLATGITTADEIGAFLENHCVKCHGPEKQKARIRLDQIEGYEAKDEHLWTMIHEALSSGEMPPEDETQPSDAERKKLLSWIENSAAESTPNPRRKLNRREFSAALQDLTGLPIDFGVGMAADATVDGFDTGGDALQDAADSVAQTLEVTRRAVDSIRFLEPSTEKVVSIDFREHEFTDFRKFVDQRWKEDGIFTKSSRLKCVEGLGVYLPTQWPGERGSSFLAFPAPRDKNAVLKVKLRVRAKRDSFPGLPEPSLWVSLGGSYIDHLQIDENSRELTYAIRLEDYTIEGGDMKVMLRTFVEMPYAVEGFENDDRSKPEDKIPGGIGTYRPKWDKKVLRTVDVQPVPAIVIESIEVDYDHRAKWPPASWNASLGEIADNDESAQQLLNLWIERAWRRPASSEEQDPFFALYRNLREQEFGFDEALRSTFQSVLMGGPFRYLASTAEGDETIAQHAIASRLSFMLVGAPPDEDLRKLAAAGKMRDPNVLDAQVDRLLDDPHSDAFFEPFVTQWLKMDQPITLTMSHFKKQDFKFGRRLKESMKQETIQYIARLFHDNRPARELISSDWTMMNNVLAWHYGAEPIEGSELRKVALKKSDPRGGGILGHAGIQSMLCWMGDNWVIYRGAWALDHILDDPPPPPPLEVPELNPSDKENQGKSFRELLVQHQADENCSICHQKMDPMGFAFQNFDISGRWRDVEHDRYHRYELDGKIEWRGEGKTRPVDAVGQLPRGEKFASFEECKEQLVEHYLDDVVRGVLKKLTLYGTGRKANVSDLATIDSIMNEQTRNGYAMRDLLKALIRSEVFLGR